MNAKDLTSLRTEAKQRMDQAVEHGKKELSGVRTGRASTNMLDAVHVEAYGSMMPLNQVAQLSIPDPMMIVAQPFDPTLIKAVEKGIQAANLGLNPTNDGKVIRIPLPEMSRERRQEFVKLAKRMAEEGRVAMRNERRQAIEALKKVKAGGGVSEDDIKGAEQEIQKLTDQYIKKLDDHLAHKEKEILTV